jgi:RNA polymerase sigma-70 factor (ECF subfamily)
VTDVRIVDEVTSDADVAAGIREGSHAALRVAFERWGSLIYTYALRILGDTHDADDVTQQTFVAAWSSRHLLRPEPSALPGWLIGIAKHRIADVQRSRARGLRTASAIAGQPEAPTPSIDQHVTDRVVVAYELDRLGDPKATIVRRAYVEDVPLATIAEDLGLPLNTVKSHARRGLAQLRERLKGVADHE